MSSIYIAITAHNPLNRLKTTLKVLEGYESLPLNTEVEIFVDNDHAEDVDELSYIVDSHTKLRNIKYIVASPEFTGYYLCWAHKPNFIKKVKNREHSFYMYSENDMVFKDIHFNYWFKYKDVLKRKNLEPGFCRFERWGGKKIPFDNYRKWNLLGPTENCWGNISHNGGFITTPLDSSILGFVSLGNPYAGLMVLDQDQADKYITSDSCDPNKSYSKTGKRNWPIADRSSMGLAFEDLLTKQEHRRVVPTVRRDNKITIPDYALVEHLDSKYSSTLLQKESIIDTETMFAY